MYFVLCDFSPQSFRLIQMISHLIAIICHTDYFDQQGTSEILNILKISNMGPCLFSPVTKTFARRMARSQILEIFHGDNVKHFNDISSKTNSFQDLLMGEFFHRKAFPGTFPSELMLPCIPLTPFNKTYHFKFNIEKVE